MSEAPVNVAKPAAQQERRTSRAWLRWGLGAWWVVILYLAFNLRDTVVSALWPALHDWLQALLALVGSWPLWEQIGFGVLVALALGGLAWLTYLAFWTWRKAEQEAARAEKGGRIEELKEGNKPLQQPLEQLVELTKEQNELLSQRQEQEAPPLSPGVIAPTGMPRAASLIGRDAVLADLMAKLRAGATMGVFALRGMGGVGKTALAAEAVARLASEQDSFPGGAAWISCENLTGSEGLAELWGRVARALRLEQVASQPDPQTRRAALANALAQGKPLLLALDNIEPGLDAETALDTLAIEGHTALLLTARQPVAPNRLESIEIKPLDPPPAAELFRQRLRQVAAARPTTEDERAVPALLEALGGLPLALELTAAYAGLQRLPLADVLREVEDDGLRAAALQGDPQRALEARFDRSWRVLAPRQQRLFAGLSLLGGASFPREAVLALARATLAKTNAGAASDLTTLVDYALVEPLEGGRLRLHPLLREYAANKLKALPQAQRERLGDAMVAFWLAYAEAHLDYEGMDALEAEAAGLIGALAWAHAHARHREVLGLAKALSLVWDIRGRREEELRMYIWADSAAQRLGDEREKHWAAHQLANVQWKLGQVEQLRANLQRALKLARNLEDLPAIRAEIHALAVLDAQVGNTQAAQEGYEQALEMAQKLDDLHAQWVELHALAVFYSHLGQLPKALAFHNQALALVQKLDDPRASLSELKMAATFSSLEGQLDRAQTIYEQALDIARGLRDRDAEVGILCNFGLLLWGLGERERSCTLVSEGLKISEELGYIEGMAECHRTLAILEKRQGNTSNAIIHAREALRYFEQIQSPSAADTSDDLKWLEESVELEESSLTLKQEQELVHPALLAFINTQSWEELYAVLEREQALLLRNSASRILAIQIAHAWRNGKENEAAFLEMRHKLLVRAREVGIEAAWATLDAERRAFEERAKGGSLHPGGE